MEGARSRLGDVSGGPSRNAVAPKAPETPAPVSRAPDDDPSSLCRICGQNGSHFVPIFEGEGLENDLSLKINSYLPVKVNIDDELPLQLCYQCASALIAWHNLYQCCLRANIVLSSKLSKSRGSDGAQRKENDAGNASEAADSNDKRISRSGDSSKSCRVASETEERIEIVISPIGETSNGDDRGSKKDAKSVKCEICSGTMLSKSYKRHMMSHESERRYVCHECGKGFKNSGALSRHGREVHNRILRFPCGICSSSFACKRTMEEHRLTHSSDRSYVCDECGKGFRQQSSLNIHKKIHLNVFPFRCALCSKRFKRRQELNSHVSVHTGVKPHRCRVCDKTFRSKKESDDHFAIHSDERSFSCNVCKQTFKRKRYVTKHLRTKHGDAPCPV